MSSNAASRVSPEVVVTSEKPPPPPGPTLLDKLGGPDKMLALMDEFYGRVVVDPQLSRFFQNIDVIKLKRHSLNIIATAFSPDAPPSNDSSAPLINDIPAYLAKTHKNMFEKQGHTEEHFDLFVGHFGDTMASVGVEEETMQEAKEKLLRFRIVFEEGAQKAADKMKKKRESKVRFSSSEQGNMKNSIGDLYVRSRETLASMSEDPKWRAVGLCVFVVGVITASSIVLKRRRA